MIYKTYCQVLLKAIMIYTYSWDISVLYVGIVDSFITVKGEITKVIESGANVKYIVPTKMR